MVGCRDRGRALLSPSLGVILQELGSMASQRDRNQSYRKYTASIRNAT